jgi:Tol biopolymer transport system component
VQLTGASASGYNTDPAFSPDGSKIAWVRSDGIWIMHADSTGEEWFADGEHPAWSPDGKRLAFVRADRKEDDSEIFKKALGAARAKRVTDNRVGFEAGPAWSPYGSRIAFSHSQGGYDGCLPCVGPSDIFSVRPDGTRRWRITDLPDAEGVDAYAPNWSPDGERLVFGAYHYGRLEQGSIETVRADGTGQQTVFAPDGRYALSPPSPPTAPG